MPFAAALSRHPDPADATGEVLGAVLEQLPTGVDVAVVFHTGHHLAAVAEITGAVRKVLQPGALIAASAVAVLAGGEGIEDEPGLSLWAGNLGGDPVRAVHLAAVPDGDTIRIDGCTDEDLAEAGALVMVADPFTFPVAEFVARLDRDHPHLLVIGGLASAGARPGGNRLVADDRVEDHGAVALLLPPAVRPDSVVSQGCRPIGQPWVVTGADGNELIELAGRPALERVAEMLQQLDPMEQALAAGGLHCGIVVDEHQVEFERGDFLIRAVIGADRERRSVTIGDVVEVGSTVQFQIRDAATAGEDLAVLLAGAVAARAGDAALVFTCNGRGSYMFGDADHDAQLVEQQIGGAVAGMFCAGEIGPVAGHTALHGFTASVAVFRDPTTVAP